MDFVGKKGAGIGVGMSRSSLSSSPARSSISTTAIVGGHAATAVPSLDDYHILRDISSVQDRKNEATAVLKSELMAALNKEVKSLDEDSWMFEGPRSRIHLISRPGGLLHQRLEISKYRNLPAKK